MPAELLATQAQLHADRPFLSFALGERDLTYAETAAEADVVAAGLARLGVRHGDRVLLMMRNRAEFVLSWLGAARLGAVQVRSTSTTAGRSSSTSSIRPPPRC